MNNYHYAGSEWTIEWGYAVAFYAYLGLCMVLSVLVAVIEQDEDTNRNRRILKKIDHQNQEIIQLIKEKL